MLTHGGRSVVAFGPIAFSVLGVTVLVAYDLKADEMPLVAARISV